MFRSSPISAQALRRRFLAIQSLKKKASSTSERIFAVAIFSIRSKTASTRRIVPFTHAKSNFTKFGLNWDIPRITAEETAYGVAMYGTRANGITRVNHYVMPNILYIKGSPESAKEGWREAFAWRVPIDDVTHRSFNIALGACHRRGGTAVSRAPAPAAGDSIGAAVRRPDGGGGACRKISVHDIEEHPDLVNIQDHVTQEGQGAIEP